MDKIIEIDGKSVKFRTSAALPLMYRMKFKRDIFSDMQHIAKQAEVTERLKKEAKADCEKRGVPYDESQFEDEIPAKTMETFERIAFVMSRHADPSQPDDLISWLEQFETFSIYQALPEIVTLWQDGNHQLSKPKKGNGK